MRVGYVGLGAMGAALARRLLLSRALTVYDLNDEALGRIVESGGEAAPSAAALARSCDVVMLCLPRSSDVRRAVFGPGGLAEGLSRGSVVIDQTSGDPAVSNELAVELDRSGIKFLDAPVSGGARGAEAGTIAIMVSGEQDVFETVRPLLESISPNVDYCSSRVGDAQALKLVNNVMNACCRVATLEAVALGRKMGLDLQTMIDVINLGSGRNRMSKVLLPALAAGRPPGDFAMSLMLKDVDLATGLGMECGAPMPIANASRAALQAALNMLGEPARADDLVKFTEAIAGTRLLP